MVPLAPGVPGLLVHTHAVGDQDGGCEIATARHMEAETAMGPRVSRRHATHITVQVMVGNYDVITIETFLRRI